MRYCGRPTYDAKWGAGTDAVLPIRVSEATPVESAAEAEIEIEFVSELGRVFVVREGEFWRCSVKLAGHGAEGEGDLDSDGERTAAYQCFEYLSHLLKHDILFVDMAVPEDTKAGPKKKSDSPPPGGPRKKRGH